MRHNFRNTISGTAASSGMTLLEVVAVLLVLTVLAATAASRMNTGTLDLAATTEGIASRIRLVQTIAMNSSPGIQGIRFEATGQTYYMFHCDDPFNCDMTADMQLLPVATFDDREDPYDNTNVRLKVSVDGKVVVSSDGNVAFDGFGKPYQITGNQAVALASPLDFLFSDIAGNPGDIQITPKTGFIP